MACPREDGDLFLYLVQRIMLIVCVILCILVVVLVDGTGDLTYLVLFFVTPLIASVTGPLIASILLMLAAPFRERFAPDPDAFSGDRDVAAPLPAPDMNVVVKTLSGRACELQVAKAQSVGQLMLQISALSELGRIPVAAQRLLVEANKTVLDAARSKEELGACGMEHGTVIHLMRQVKPDVATLGGDDDGDGDGAASGQGAGAASSACEYAASVVKFFLCQHCDNGFARSQTYSTIVAGVAIALLESESNLDRDNLVGLGLIFGGPWLLLLLVNGVTIACRGVRPEDCLWPDLNLALHGIIVLSFVFRGLDVDVLGSTSSSSLHWVNGTTNRTVPAVSKVVGDKPEISFAWLILTVPWYFFACSYNVALRGLVSLIDPMLSADDLADQLVYAATQPPRIVIRGSAFHKETSGSGKNRKTRTVTTFTHKDAGWGYCHCVVRETTGRPFDVAALRRSKLPILLSAQMRPVLNAALKKTLAGDVRAMKARCAREDAQSSAASTIHDRNIHTLVWPTPPGAKPPTVLLRLLLALLVVSVLTGTVFLVLVLLGLFLHNPTVRLWQQCDPPGADAAAAAAAAGGRQAKGKGKEEQQHHGEEAPAPAIVMRHNTEERQGVKRGVHHNV